MSLGLTFIPGSSVDIETGEFTDIDLSIGSTSCQVSIIIKSNYTQEHIHRVQQITWPMGESIVCKLLGCKTVVVNNKSFDAIFPNGEQLEIKVGRIGNGAVLKRNQLDNLDKQGFYALVYYRTTQNLPPSYFISKEGLKISPEEYLKRNIFFESIFLFPKSLMVYYYNTSKIKELIIRGSGINHKTISFKNALNLFDSEELLYELGLKKHITQRVLGKDIIDIYSIF